MALPTVCQIWTTRTALFADKPGLILRICRSRARINGATQTFRRPSVATSILHQRDGSQSINPTASSGVYVPPHLSSNYQPSFPRNSSTVDARYSKEQLLDLFRAHGESGGLYKNASEHLLEGWNPSAPSSAANGTWNRRGDYKDGNSGPEICWDHEGSIQPLGLIDMSEEEKEVRRWHYYNAEYGSNPVTALL